MAYVFQLFATVLDEYDSRRRRQPTHKKKSKRAEQLQLFNYILSTQSVHSSEFQDTVFRTSTITAGELLLLLEMACSICHRLIVFTCMCVYSCLMRAVRWGRGIISVIFSRGTILECPCDALGKILLCMVFVWLPEIYLFFGRAPWLACDICTALLMICKSRGCWLLWLLVECPGEIGLFTSI